LSQLLHIITGTTAAGKTDYALAYAEAHDAEIVSCDASLFYRGMDIGTAKPTSAERSRVPHHLIDICDVSQPFDIVAYVEAARRAVDSICARGKSVVITGGSGFYLKSFLAPVLDTIEVPAAVRQQVDRIDQAGGLEALCETLIRHNPGGLPKLDIKNPRRVRRALERCLASGRTLEELQAEFAAQPDPYADFGKRLILIEREKEQLMNRIALRAEAMLAAGLIDEVRRLREAGIEQNPSAAAAIGYRETLAFLDQRLEGDQLVPTIIRNTRRLAKKQRTWLRTQIRQPDEIVSF